MAPHTLGNTLLLNPHPRSGSDFPCLYSLTIQGNNYHGFLIVLRVVSNADLFTL